ncbi:ankyrin repeat and LEM domain-containing protein 2-like isoform X2 [Acanthaster planci]|uniref:Ankyrin repeat and LEM domain-containing protein 2-like isoform X2 n=1 Tax=Acanthaster planci TaxID=133434 RepID=A0A8B7YIX3_ACAPL|nr:ankyrin repeat and LEM domain-containing protein 2-like isoform X2 [Acanthaster planci]
MDAILQRLAKLTEDELRAELRGCGLKPIPITKTTRALVQRCLAKHLWQLQGGGVPEEGERDSSAEKKEETGGGDSVTEPGEQNSPTKSAGGTVLSYFAVCIPPKNESSSAGGDDVDSSQGTGNSDEILIFQDRKEALNIAKKNKGARFKVFKTKEEAESFAKSNQDLSTPKPAMEPMLSQSLAEKPVSSFRSVKTQDLVILRRTIEANDAAKFKELVWSNPRYLINAGDCPTVLQEGSRYNALHVAAKENRPEICAQILATICDSAYILMMYPNDPEDTIVSRKDYLADLYLNSPDKGNAETPLHFACKFGNAKVVEILINHPQCDKTLKNGDGQTGSEIVCSRSSLSGTALRQLQKTISDILHENYYVPVYRSEGNCTPPVIGEPWSPDLSDHQSSPLFHTRPAGAESPINAVLSLQAYAGPMSPAEAGCFRRNLQTPPSMERKRVGRIRRADGEKGVERIGRELASKMKVSWAEYWSFLDAFVDLASPQGLQKLEKYLAARYTGIHEDVGTQESTVKQEQTCSTVSPGAVMKVLAGDFEKVSIDSAEDDRVGTDCTKEMRTCGDGQDQPSCFGMDCERAREGRTESQAELGSNDMPADSIEKGKEVADTNDGMSHLHKKTSKVGNAEKLMMESEPDRQPDEACSESLENSRSLSDTMNGNRRPDEACSESQENSRPSSDTVNGNRRPDEACSESQENSRSSSDTVNGNRRPQDPLRMLAETETTSTNANCQETVAEECEQLPGVVAEPGGSDSCQKGSDVVDVVCQSEISSKSEVSVNNQVKTDGNPDLPVGDTTGTSCIMSAKEDYDSTQRQNGDIHDQGSLSTSGLGDCHPRTAEKKNVSLKTETVACREPEKDKTISGNGDGNADIFRTPKMVSSRRAVSNAPSGGLGNVGFILGPQPTRTDLHVWRALAEVEVPDNFPCIRQWKQFVSSVPCETRDRWPTPSRAISSRLPLSRPSQTPSPRQLRAFFDSSPLVLRARHLSEPTHHSSELAPSLRLRQAQFNQADSPGDPRTRLFQG